MGNQSIYDEIINVAQRENWKRVGIQEKNGNALEVMVYSFKDGKATNIYSGRIGELDASALISPDSKEVAFWLRDRPGVDTLSIVNIETHNLKKIIGIPEGFGLAWSSDSKRIAFVGALTKEDSAKFQHSLFVVDIKTGEIKSLPIGNIGSLTHQSFSPDDLKIVYVKSLGENNYITVYDLNKNESLQLVEGNTPMWSLDGLQIAYLDADNGISIISPDGKNKEKLIKSDVSSQSESMEGMTMGPIYWFPNGEYLFYTKCLSSQCEIGSPHVIRISTRKSEEVSQYNWIFSSWSQ